MPLDHNLNEVLDVNYSPLPGLQPDLGGHCWLVLFAGQVVLNDENSLWYRLDKFQLAIKQEAIVTGYLHGKAAGIVELSSLTVDTGTISIRTLLSESDPAVYSFLSHGLQILTSRREHAFCGCCGHQMQAKAGEWAMVCVQCGHHAYPRISPCVIVLVTRGDEMLLVRHQRHGKNSTMHTLVAGFVEPGESAEEAVHREVLEETGLTLGKLHYCFSQSWPFPHSLMMGFHGEYQSGEIVLEEKELCFGGWFHRDNPPELPPKFTIARKLVDLFF
ncbi:NAD(+) diphosphatase [Endozoicomonas sp. ONNA2]|uniref:NAD(+) diphosphatase n=1 Tax=Endozoicomonas sp. ONNA2 TaxID=2828741 RepID=UPI0021473FA3|nr:NAD(+) diphosphatase [Endozoicomonas sp. ONNA2]